MLDDALVRLRLGHGRQRLEAEALRLGLCRGDHLRLRRLFDIRLSLDLGSLRSLGSTVVSTRVSGVAAVAAVRGEDASRDPVRLGRGLCLHRQRVVSGLRGVPG